jgi:hypothetical protein
VEVDKLMHAGTYKEQFVAIATFVDIGQMEIATTMNAMLCSGVHIFYVWREK